MEFFFTISPVDAYGLFPIRFKVKAKYFNRITSDSRFDRLIRISLNKFNFLENVFGWLYRVTLGVVL